MMKNLDCGGKNRIVNVRDLNSPNIDWGCFNDKGLDGVELFWWNLSSLFMKASSVNI